MKFDEDGLNNIGDVKVPHTYRNHTDKCKKKNDLACLGSIE